MIKKLVLYLVILFIASQFVIRPARGDSIGNSNLAFLRDGDVWLIAADGNGLEQLTADNVYKAIAWSPDGSLILAVRNDNQIDLVNPISQEIINIRYQDAYPKLTIHPVWSPDSQLIALGAQGTKLYVFNRTGEKTGDFDASLVDEVAWGNDSLTLYFGEEQNFWKLNISSGEKEPLYTAEYSVFIEPQVYISPTDSSIAVWAYGSEGNGDLYFFTVDGNNKLTIHGGQPTGDWSPDGTQFVFQTGNTAFANAAPITIYNAQDSSINDLYEQGGLNPRWSPDGARIAFATWKGGLSVIDPETKKLLALLPDAPQRDLAEYRSQGGPDAKTIGYFATPNMMPAWSPDGKQLTFTYPNGFYMIDAETGKSQWYKNANSPQWQTHTRATPPPSSSVDINGWIAFIGNDHNVWMVHPDGSGLLQVTKDAGENTTYDSLKWSPDGSSLAFIRRSNDAASILRLNIVSFDIETLYSDDSVDLGMGGDTGLDWSPDASQIIFTTASNWQPDGTPLGTVSNKGLFIVDVSSKAIKAVIAPDPDHYLINPDWSPKKSYVIFDSCSPGMEVDWCNYQISDLDNPGSSKLFGNWSHQIGEWAVSWNPDGEEVALITWKWLNPEQTTSKSLMLVNTIGEILLELKDIRAVSSAEWSPDGKWLAVLIDQSANLYKLSLFTPDGSGKDILAKYLVPLDWSPDSKWLLVKDNENRISIVDITTGAQNPISVGDQAVWQPAQSATNIDIKDLLQTKRDTILQLTTTTYTALYNQVDVPIKAYDENKAIELINKLDGIYQDISPEQAAAFSRLVLQEQTLAQTLNDYSILSNDSADAQVDFAGISTGFITALKAVANPPTALSDLAQKTFQDYLKLWTWQIKDPERRALVQDGIDGASDTISSKTVIGSGETFLNIAMDANVRAEAANKNITLLVGKVQQTIDQYTEITDAAGNGVSVVDNTDQMAQLQLDHIQSVSAISRETTHSQYEQLVRGRDLNELFKDIADIISVSSKNPTSLIISVWTRILQSPTDGFALHLLGNSMNCISQVSERAGALSFHPEQQLVSCDDPSKLKLLDTGPATWVDGPAWKQTQGRLESAIQDYGMKTVAVQTAFAKGDAKEIQKTTSDLSKAQETTDELTTITMGLLTPPDGQSGTADTISITQKIVEMELNMVGLQLGTATYSFALGA